MEKWYQETELLRNAIVRKSQYLSKSIKLIERILVNNYQDLSKSIKLIEQYRK